MKITTKDFGLTKDGKMAHLYEIENASGSKVTVSDMGAVIVKIEVPDREGKLADVILGYDNVPAYEINDNAHGAVVGRSANRIEKGQFKIGDKEYQLAVNDRGANNLHCGPNAYYTRLYDTKTVDEANGAVTFVLLSPDGDQGMPGNLEVLVTYSFDDECKLTINYKAVSDQDTVINLTNHGYFNLGGHDSGCALDELVYIDADKFTVTDELAIPHGEERDVTGTPFDLRVAKPAREGVNSDYEQIQIACGYDKNFVLNNPSLEVPCANVYDEKSGRFMEIYTDLPGLQFYSGNFVGNGTIGKGGYEYQNHGGMAFESQYAPNAVNVPSFPQPVFKAGEEYNKTTIYKFSVK